MPQGWQPPQRVNEPEQGKKQYVLSPVTPMSKLFKFVASRIRLMIAFCSKRNDSLSGSHPGFSSATHNATSSFGLSTTAGSASSSAYPYQTSQYDTASYNTVPPRYAHLVSADQPGSTTSGYVNNNQAPNQLYGTFQTSTSAYNYGKSGYTQQLGPSTTRPQHMPKGKGKGVLGTYTGPNTLHYEELDPSYFVRDKSFFYEGRVFSIILSENAGSHASARARTKVTDYTTSSLINEVRFKNNFIYTTVRRFVVVRQKREFCFACPIFTYSGRATTKPGVRPAEHGIIYTWGETAQLLPGERGISKASLSVVMANNEPPLDKASRIYYGIYHPIQYNVKVKEIGYVPRDQVPILIGQWKQEDNKETEQSSEVTQHADAPLVEADEPEKDKETTNMSGGSSSSQPTSVFQQPYQSYITPAQIHTGYSQPQTGYHQSQAAYAQPKTAHAQSQTGYSHWGYQQTTQEEEEDDDDDDEDDAHVDQIISMAVERSEKGRRSEEEKKYKGDGRYKKEVINEQGIGQETTSPSLGQDSSEQGISLRYKSQSHAESTRTESQPSKNEMEQGDKEADEDCEGSIHELVEAIKEDFDMALHKDKGWAWTNIDLAGQVHEESIRLQHWNSSVVGFATRFVNTTTDNQSHEENNNDATRQLLDTLQKERPYLSGLIMSYLSDIQSALSGLKTVQSNHYGEER
jgi:hypothetical protein